MCCYQEILEAVKNMQLASIADIWQQFWTGPVDFSEYEDLFFLSHRLTLYSILQSLWLSEHLRCILCSDDK